MRPSGDWGNCKTVCLFRTQVKTWRPPWKGPAHRKWVSLWEDIFPSSCCEVTVNISNNVTVSLLATTSLWLYPQPPRHRFYELCAQRWPITDGLVWLGGWKQRSWFPRSFSALFCTNIYKYFTSICSELSPRPACLRFCISVAVRLIKERK